MQTIIICIGVFYVFLKLLVTIFCINILYSFNSYSAELNSAEQIVNIYSFRKTELIEPLLDEFRKQTGIKVNVVSGKADKLMDRLIADGDNSFADVLLTVDVSRLEKAKQLNLIQPINSTLLMNNIPEKLRDPEHYWFAVSLRARAIFFAKTIEASVDIVDYQQLTDKKWRGKICSRKGSHFYNRSMIANFIYRNGMQWTDNWLKQFVNNLAERPHGGDRDQLRKIVKENCELAIANTYYYGMLSASNKQSDRDVYQQVGVVFPNRTEHGVHINISGAAVTRAAKNKDNAILFVEFLATANAQKIYTEMNYEYPVNSKLSAGKLLNSWGTPKMDLDAILHLTEYHQQAIELINKHHW